MPDHSLQHIALFASPLTIWSFSDSLTERSPEVWGGLRSRIKKATCITASKHTENYYQPDVLD